MKITYELFSTDNDNNYYNDSNNLRVNLRITKIRQKNKNKVVKYYVS